MKRSTKFLGLIAALPLVSGLAFQGLAVAQEDSLTYDFLSCVKNSKTGSVVILMDESGSIYGKGDKAGSDPQNMRITGAQILVDDLQRVAELSQGEVKIQLAGLGDNFVSRSNGWVALTGDSPETAETLKKTANDAWVKRPSDDNSRETDILSSLAGAQKALQPEVGCKLLVVFKDGKDWQSLNPNNTSSVDFPSVQSAISTGDFIEAKRLALNEICRPMGIADGLRADSVNMLAVALGTGGFDELRDLVEGRNCGERPGVGEVLNAENPQDLPSLFKQALDPNSKTNERTGPFTFSMTSDLQGITVLTSGLDSIDDLSLQPPGNCQAVSLPSATSNGAAGKLNSSVDWKATPYGSSGTVQIRLTNQDRSNAECWSGQWSVEPGNPKAKSVIEVDPNLEAVATFEDQDVYLVPGSETPTRFTVSLQRLDDGSAVSAESLGPDSKVSVDGYLLDENNVKTQVFAGGVLSREGLETAIPWTVPADLAFGNYKLVLATALEVPGVDLNAKTVTWERDIEVRGELAAPVVLNAPINFGEIDGSSEASAEIEVQNRSDKDMVILLSDIGLELDQAPEGLEYSIVGGQEEVALAANQTTKFRLALKPQAERVDGFGSVNGDLEMVAAVAEARNKTAPFSGEFFSVQKASADENARWFLIALFMLLAALGTLGAVALVNYLASRFPKAQDATQISAFTADVMISKSGIDLTQGYLADRIYRDMWHSVEFVSRKEVRIDGTPIKAKSPGLRLSGNGFGDVALAGVGLGSESPTSSAGARIGLAIEGSYILSTDLSSEDVKKLMESDSPVKGKITLLTSDRSKADQIFSMASSSPLLQNFGVGAAVKPERVKKEKTPKTDKGLTQPTVDATQPKQDDFW
jgi:hypothetical protein